MDTGREEQRERLFEEAAALPPEARAAFLEAACPDAALRADLTSLLALHDEASAYLGRLADNVLAPTLGALLHQARPPGAVLDAETGADPLPGRRFGHYEILGMLGTGGMGRVYRARDTKLGRPVALKFLPPHLAGSDAAQQRFMQEAKAASALDHANIATVYEIAETGDGQLYIAMALCEGETLKQKLLKGPLPVDEVLAYTIEVAEALRAAHAAGIVHRDVKPANVIVSPDGKVKLVDFGVAKLTDVEQTRAGRTMGTVAYMSPEQTRGEGVDHRADLWSLGVVLYELLEGQRPFRGEHEPAVIYAIRQEAPAAALRPEVPEALRRVVEKLLQKDPDARYERAEALLADLYALRRGDEIATRRVGRPSPLRQRRLVAAGVALLLLLGAGLSLLRLPRAPAASGTALPEAAVRSAATLAVLPFQNNSGDPEQAYFTAGLSDALVAELAKLEALRVVSLLQYEEGQKPLPELLTEWEVGVVLEGSVFASDDQAGIAVRLTDAETGVLLWSERFERALRDVVTLQREVALAIAHEVAGTLTPQDQARLHAAEAVDEEAYRLYLKGIQARNADEGPSAGPPVKAYFEQAVAKDPDFTLAWAWLANISALMKDEAVARRAADRALALDPDLPEAHIALGQIRGWIDWDWAGAEQAFRRAVALGPGNGEAHHELGQHLLRMGRFEEALVENERALQANPLSPRYQLGVGEVYFYTRQYGRALEVFEDITASFPDYSFGHLYKGYTYLQQGKKAQAIEVFEQLGSPTHLGIAYAAVGRRAEAWAVFEELKKRAEADATYTWALWIIPALLGEREQALDWLERAYEARAGLMYLKVWPLYDSLRSEPRFQAVLKKMGLD